MLITSFSLHFAIPKYFSMHFRDATKIEFSGPLSTLINAPKILQKCFKLENEWQKILTFEYGDRYDFENAQFPRKQY